VKHSQEKDEALARVDSMKSLVLASHSPRRRELLEKLGLPYSVLQVDIDEKFLPGESIEAGVQRLAAEKAFACSSNRSEGVVIGCDTVVAVDDQVLGKPQDSAEARSMLRTLSGRSHQVISGVAVLDAKSGALMTAYERTIVYFQPLLEEEIEAYVASGEPLDKAGAYAIQGKAARFIPRIEGCYYNVVGLPLHCLASLLKKMGIPVK
jgi:septum formation protein